MWTRSASSSGLRPMAKPPADQHCMFCDPNPCECHTPKKKASPKKRSKPSASAPTAPAAATADSTSSLTQSSAPPNGSSVGQDTTPAFDPRAAMKAMASVPVAPTAECVPEDYASGSDISSRRIRSQISAEQRHTPALGSGGPECVLNEETAASLDADERRAVFALGPLLGDAQINACQSIFKDPTLRAERWKEQRRG